MKPANTQKNPPGWAFLENPGFLNSGRSPHNLQRPTTRANTTAKNKRLDSFRPPAGPPAQIKGRAAVLLHYPNARVGAIQSVIGLAVLAVLARVF